IQALLRLAPTQGTAALRQAAKVPGEFGQALLYALGGKAITIGLTPGLWVAAARARAPLVDDLAVEARHPNLGPDAGTAARLSLRTHRHQNRDYFHLEHEPPVPAKVPCELATVLLHAGGRASQWWCPAAHWDAATVRWAGTVWPACREPWF